MNERVDRVERCKSCGVDESLWKVEYGRRKGCGRVKDTNIYLESPCFAHALSDAKDRFESGSL